MRMPSLLVRLTEAMARVLVEVRVNRLLSGDGPVSIDFSTVDGVTGFAG